MQIVKVGEELWASNILPEGILERWRVPHGETVKAGQAVAEVRIEGALHEIAAPGHGVLAHEAKSGDVIQPGDQLGQVA